MKPTQAAIWGLPVAALLATGSLPSSRLLAIAESVKPGASALQTKYGSLPMSFEKNAGQTRIYGVLDTFLMYRRRRIRGE